MLKTTQPRFTTTLIAFFIVLMLVTLLVIRYFVAPQLSQNEGRLVRYEVNSYASIIVEQMNRIQAQQRAISEAAGDLEANTFWNTDGADKYWEHRKKFSVDL